MQCTVFIILLVEINNKCIGLFNINRMRISLGFVVFCRHIFCCPYKRLRFFLMRHCACSVSGVLQRALARLF